MNVFFSAVEGCTNKVFEKFQDGCLVRSRISMFTGGKVLTNLLPISTKKSLNALTISC